jgi:hypothetical protein
VAEIGLGAGGATPSLTLAAARLLGAAEALRDPQDATMWPPERVARERVLPALREVLGEEGLAAALAQGRELTVDQAIEEARRLAIG